jgi:Glycosyl hydrolase family 9
MLALRCLIVSSDRVPCRLSPDGQRFTLKWGSNRYAVSGAAILLMWARLPPQMRGLTSVDTQSAQCAAVKQIHFVAGDNDHGSYIVGFGSNAPVRNHHRNAACAPWEQAEDPPRNCEQYAPRPVSQDDAACGVADALDCTPT